MGAIFGMVVKDLGMSVHDFRSFMNSYRIPVLTPAAFFEMTMKLVVYSFCDMALLRRSEMDHVTPPLYRPKC